jgi:hypothetical protein
MLWGKKVKSKSLQKEFNQIKYKTYPELSAHEKRILYAWELYKDGASLTDASSSATTSSMSWIEGQLQDTFSYSKESIIQ